MMIVAASVSTAQANSMSIRKMWAISQSNSAVNILCIDGGSAVVELVNSTAHLYHF